MENAIDIATQLFGQFAVRALKRKQVYGFAGVRRSGNHACINWMANAVLGGEANFISTRKSVSVTECGCIVHFNEVNRMGIRQFASIMREHKNEIRKADFIFISTEDLEYEQGRRFWTSNCCPIVIVRSVLSTCASRLTYNIKRAREGIDRGDVGIDAKFFRCLRSLHQAGDPAHIWSYDKWISDAQWRESYLERLALRVDIKPGMSHQGGGSSFHGQNNRTMTDEQRWSQVEWPARVLQLLEKNEDLLSESEKEFLAQKNQADGTA